VSAYRTFEAVPARMVGRVAHLENAFAVRVTGRVAFPGDRRRTSLQAYLR